MRVRKDFWVVLVTFGALVLAVPGCGGSDKSAQNAQKSKVNKIAAAKKALQDAIEAEEAGKINVADRRYRRALRLRPGHFETVSRFTSFLIAQGDTDEAVQVASNFLARDIGDLKGYLLLADAYIAAKKWVNAYSTLDELIRLDEGDGRAFEKRGNVQVMRNNFDDALKDLRHAIELDNENPDFHASLGSALHRANRLGEAAISLRHALQLEPDHARAHVILGVVLREQAEVKEALKHHELAARYAPRSARAHFELGVTQNFAGNNPGAEVSLKRATELDPRDAINWYAYGEVLRNMERYQEAVAPYRKALEIDPNYTKAADKLGVVLYYAGDLDAAETLLTDRVRSYPKEPYAYFNLGQVYAKAQKYQMAIDAFQKFIELAPANDGDIPVARRKIAELRRKVPRLRPQR